MKVIRKLTRNGNSTTVSFHPAILDFMRWRPGDHLVLEVRSREEVVLRLPHDADLRCPIEASTLNLTPPVEVTP